MRGEEVERALRGERSACRVETFALIAAKTVLSAGIDENFDLGPLLVPAVGPDCEMFTRRRAHRREVPHCSALCARRRFERV